MLPAMYMKDETYPSLILLTVIIIVNETVTLQEHALVSILQVYSNIWDKQEHSIVKINHIAVKNENEILPVLFL